MKYITKNIVFAAVAAVMLFAGCDTEDPIYDVLPTASGTITLITDWSQIGTGNTVPSNYAVRVGDYSVLLTGETNEIENLFTTGNCTAYVYNTAESITISGTMATVAGAATPTGATGSFINNAPGWMYACRLDETISENTDYNFTALMVQQVRELTFVLTLTGEETDMVSTVTGILTGVAGSYDMSNGTHSMPSNVAMTFAKQTSGEYEGKYIATVRFLGIVGNDQTITISITYADNILGTQVVGPKSVSGELAMFNTNKRTPVSLDIDMETLTRGTITLTTDWSQIGTGNTVPSNYTLRMGNYSVMLVGETNSFDNLFTPGDYTAYVYNTAENITIAGTMATVVGAATPAGATGSFVNSTPDWMYTCRLDETIGKNTDHNFTAVMAQQVRELTFVLTPTGDAADMVSTVTGVLTGVAGSYDMSDGMHSVSSNVAMTFAKQTTGTYAGKYTATVRLLGIVGDDQTITLSSTYTNPTLGTVVEGPTNISGDLATFNTNKRTPMALDLEMETPTINTGVLINGIRWADSNVDNFGTFAATPESYGMFYQFNRKVAWLSEGSSPVSSPAGEPWRSDNTGSVNDVWEADNDPCPEGWRVPIYSEYATLLDTTKVDSEKITVAGIVGYKFTDKVSGISVFLPSAGYRHPSDGVLRSPGGIGLYGIGTTRPELTYNNGSWFMVFQSADPYFYFNDRANGVSIRCVCED